MGHMNDGVKASGESKLALTRDLHVMRLVPDGANIAWLLRPPGFSGSWLGTRHGSQGPPMPLAITREFAQSRLGFFVIGSSR
jgi:hypothetical protein